MAHIRKPFSVFAIHTAAKAVTYMFVSYICKQSHYIILRSNFLLCHSNIYFASMATTMTMRRRCTHISITMSRNHCARWCDICVVQTKRVHAMTFARIACFCCFFVVVSLVLYQSIERERERARGCFSILLPFELTWRFLCAADILPAAKCERAVNVRMSVCSRPGIFIWQRESGWHRVFEPLQITYAKGKSLQSSFRLRLCIGRGVGNSRREKGIQNITNHKKSFE